MSTKTLLRAAIKAARTAVIGILLASLFAAGATAAKRGYLEEQKNLKKNQAPVVSVDSELVKPPVSEEASGSMAKGSHPTTEQVCILQAGTTPSLNQNQILRHRDLSSGEVVDVLANHDSNRLFLPASSLAEAAPRVAATRTLVGAVPSGTM